MPSINGIPFDAELKMAGKTVAAQCSGKFQVDPWTGWIDAIGLYTWNGRQFADPVQWLPDGQIYDLLHQILTDEYRDEIADALDEWTTRADRERDMAHAG